MLRQYHVPDKSSSGLGRSVKRFLSQRRMPAVPAHGLFREPEGADHEIQLVESASPTKFDGLAEVLELLACSPHVLGRKTAAIVEARRL
jgi:hypothetical protein